VNTSIDAHTRSVSRLTIVARCRYVIDPDSAILDPVERRVGTTNGEDVDECRLTEAQWFSNRG
jgi:hypothetical protein